MHRYIRNDLSYFLWIPTPAPEVEGLLSASQMGAMALSMLGDSEAQPEAEAQKQSEGKVHMSNKCG